ncbi:MAG: carboxypeptidase-like regulatory domain-containing protein [Pyrinomonadaceae bacterium]
MDLEIFANCVIAFIDGTVGKQKMKRLGLLTLFFLFSVGTVFAQFGVIKGKVMLIKPDGTLTPVSGARVDYYRTDVFSKLRTDTTLSDGSFVINGLPVEGTYFIYASGPGLETDGIRNLKTGQENLVIKLKPGDGKYFPESAVEAQVRLFAFSDKQKAEEGREAEDFRAANQLLSQKKLTEAVAAYNAMIKKYFIGKLQKDAYRQKAIALNNLAVEAFQAGNRSVNDAERQQLLDKARQFTVEAVSSAFLSVNGYRFESKQPNHKPSVDFSERYSASLFISFEANRLSTLIGNDAALLPPMKKALDEYLSLNLPREQRAQAMNLYGSALRTMKAWELAVSHFELFVKEFPDDLEGLEGKAESNLVRALDVTDVRVKREMLQISADSFQKFLVIAPAGHQLRPAVVSRLALLKNHYKTEPRATGAPEASKKPINALGMWMITIKFKQGPQNFALLLGKQENNADGQMFIGQGPSFDVTKLVLTGNSVNFIAMMLPGKLPVEFKGTLDSTMMNLNGTFLYTDKGKQETGTWTAVREE